MKIYIYARQGNTATMPTIEEQLRACRNYAAQHGYTILAEYVDCEDARPEFKKMIADCEKVYAHGVLVYAQFIISRGIHDRMEKQKQIRTQGLMLVSTLEDLTSPAAILMQAIMESAYEYYCEEHSRKVKEGLRRAKERKAALATSENSPAA